MITEANVAIVTRVDVTFLKEFVEAKLCGFTFCG
jgi:hypothetical protein